MDHCGQRRTRGRGDNGRAPCSTGGGQDGSHAPPVTFDPEKLEQLLKDDMPIDIPNPYEREKVQCLLCKYNIRLDYKNSRFLSQFLSPYTGKLYGRNITRLCKKKQKELELTVEHSRGAGYLAIMLKNVEFLKDPKLFDPNQPIRPHNF
ncbi:28S ribosomal protein S18c, mitochondrial [Chionoecetes opilio]|uniref:28S ribosomal protein S18c, mitochondrial n=1 Tax=Chionoecetes opilio TaxID=41210 RepID=A0A8J5CTJ4_CHIOP|nr:28S ribosomal protein S18c, mitochondrial [Chionoecetes opilio]